MRITIAAAMLLAGLAGAAPAAASEPEHQECRRFESVQNDLQPRLARLCVLLIDAHDSADGMSQEERDAATRLGHYLAVVGELDIRRGAIGINGAPGRGQATTETARYLIAQRIGLIEIADRLAPADRQASLR